MIIDYASLLSKRPTAWNSPSFAANNMKHSFCRIHQIRCLDLIFDGE